MIRTNMPASVGGRGERTKAIESGDTSSEVVLPLAYRFLARGNY